MLKLTLCFPVLVAMLSFTACGRDDSNESSPNGQSPASVASEPSSTLTTVCEDTPLPAFPSNVYCRTLPSGKVYTVALKATTFEQDPVTCDITSQDDGMRASLVEMGFTPCDESENANS